MIPNLSPAGYSFKGAIIYVTHDKGTTLSKDRVDWISTRGMLTDDVPTAERIMLATALDSDRLKQQAGIKSSGRKSAKHVQTLTLSWHPDEQVSREEMERAADEAMKLLGMEDHQAVYAAHNDTDHDHIHLVINRVNPNDGRLASLSNSKRKLDKWAHEYEKERGAIVTPKRAEKYDRQEAASKKHTPEERRAYAEQKRKEQAESAPDSPQAILARNCIDLRNRHKEEQEELRRLQAEQRRQSYREYQAHVAELKAYHDNAWREGKEQRRKEWRDHYQAEREASRLREKMAKTSIGRLSLAITAARKEQERGSTENILHLILANFIDMRRCEKVFAAVSDEDKAKIAESHDTGRDNAFLALKAKRADQLDAMRQIQNAERETLDAKNKRAEANLTKKWLDLANTESDGESGSSDRSTTARELEENDDTRIRRLSRQFAIREPKDVLGIDEAAYAEFRYRLSEMQKQIMAGDSAAYQAIIERDAKAKADAEEQRRKVEASKQREAESQKKIKESRQSRNNGPSGNDL